MAAKKTLPYGTWPSPVTPELVARGSRRFGSLQAQGDAVYWSESRPEEGGRQVILKASAGGKIEELLPLPYSARSRVHEYGGGEFLVAGDTVYFVNDKDQQVYRLASGAPPRRITDAARTRFADFALDVGRRRLIAVAEVHGPEKGQDHAQPRNVLVAIALEGEAAGRLTELAGARDFYASPRLSPDGSELAYLAWDLPDMPWDSATLFVCQVDASGLLSRPAAIAGGKKGAAFQPAWGQDGKLYFVSDQTGWGQLYRWSDGRAERVHGARGKELMRPQWVFGTRSYALGPDGSIGLVSLSRGEPLFEMRKSGSVAGYPQLQPDTSRLDDPVALGRGFAALVARPARAPAVMSIGKSGLKPLSPPPPAEIAGDLVSKGEAITFRRRDRQTVHGIFYPPRNPRYRGPPGAAPPALVLAHGGPTAMADAGFKPRVQFYTSRGFAVLDVNYSGSTGYGRAYRQRLDGAWGIADVADCVAGARHLARTGLADGRRIAIAGGSAGGYTTLMGLATSDAFAAGCSHFGVSDLALLLAHTHKFESGYLHRLLGTTPAKWKEVFAARSPVNLVERIRAPVILFQGLDDKVVPPEQSRLIVTGLRRRGIEVAYHEYAGEAHGFRKAETIVAVLEAELAFLRRVLGL